MRCCCCVGLFRRKQSSYKYFFIHDIYCNNMPILWLISFFFTCCQALVLVLVHGPGQIKNSWSKKDQSWHYDPNTPPTTPQLFNINVKVKRHEKEMLCLPVPGSKTILLLSKPPQFELDSEAVLTSCNMLLNTLIRLDQRYLIFIMIVLAN